MKQASRTTLGDVADFINGLAFKPEDWEPTGYKIIRIQNLTDKAKPYNLTNRKVDSKFIVNPGDLLVSWSATLGVFQWDVEESAVLNQHIFRVVPDEEKVYKPFLKFALDQSVSTMDRHTHGATMKHINRAEFLNTPIQLPPLPEQKRIAAILDKADSIRRKRQEAVRLTEELLRSVFLDMFGDPVTNPKGWVCKSLDAICTKITDGEHLNPLFVDDGFPIVMANNVRSEGVNFDGVKYVSKIDFEKFTKKCKPLKNDILVVSRGATIGRCTVVDTERPFCLMGSTILIKTDNGMILPAYLNSLLQHPAFQAKLYKTSSSSAQQAIYLSHIKELSVPIPPIKEQEKFSELVLKGKKALDILSRAVIQSDDLFNSFLQRAFKGKVLNATLL